MRLNESAATPIHSSVSKIFPPASPSSDLRQDIIQRCCRRFRLDLIEEGGCAVCGQLVLSKSLVCLKSEESFQCIECFRYYASGENS